MATITAKKKVSEKWGPLVQSLSTGWYDIILISGEQHNEVYFEHGYFHFTERKPSINSANVEWIRTHTKGSR